jgi:hypothetical protein
MESPNRQFVERRQDRLKAVLPVKVTGKDACGNSFEDLAHTLDITPGGGRLGAMHRELRISDHLTVQYRQHRMEFRVVWTKLLDKAREYQVGLQMIEKDKVAWGLANNEAVTSHAPIAGLRAFATSGAA